MMVTTTPRHVWGTARYVGYFEGNQKETLRNGAPGLTDRHGAAMLLYRILHASHPILFGPRNEPIRKMLERYL